MIASNHWFAVLMTVFAWWFSTGLILILVRLPRRFHTMLLAVFGFIAITATVGILNSAKTQGIGEIYCGFICALIVWGWHEASFLMGIVTGPLPTPCPADAKGWRRFYFATATLIYHEVALFCTLLLLAIATLKSPNQIALWTFLVLFLMRLSSKLNIFLGVPNLTDEFFPDHLAHLKSYLPKRAMNPLMPISILACFGALYWQWSSLKNIAENSPPALALVIVLTLTSLGLIEHIFMITPLPDAVLWRWATSHKSYPQAVSTEEQKSDER